MATCVLKTTHARERRMKLIVPFGPAWNPTNRRVLLTEVVVDASQAGGMRRGEARPIAPKPRIPRGTLRITLAPVQTEALRVRISGPDLLAWFAVTIWPRLRRSRIWT